MKLIYYFKHISLILFSLQFVSLGPYKSKGAAKPASLDLSRKVKISEKARQESLTLSEGSIWTRCPLNYCKKGGN